MTTSPVAGGLLSEQIELIREIARNLVSDAGPPAAQRPERARPAENSWLDDVAFAHDDGPSATPAGRHDTAARSLPLAGLRVPRAALPGSGSLLAQDIRPLLAALRTATASAVTDLPASADEWPSTAPNGRPAPAVASAPFPLPGPTRSAPAGTAEPATAAMAEMAEPNDAGQPGIAPKGHGTPAGRPAGSLPAGETVARRPAAEVGRAPNAAPQVAPGARLVARPGLQETAPTMAADRLASNDALDARFAKVAGYDDKASLAIAGPSDDEAPVGPVPRSGTPLEARRDRDHAVRSAAAEQGLAMFGLGGPEGPAAEALPERAGLIASFILNAHFLPGWPPLRPIQSARGAMLAEQLALASKLAANEKDMLVYLANFGLDKERLARVMKLGLRAHRRPKLLAAIAAFLSNLSTMVRLLREEMEAMAEDLGAEGQVRLPLAPDRRLRTRLR